MRQMLLIVAIIGFTILAIIGFFFSYPGNSEPAPILEEISTEDPLLVRGISRHVVEPARTEEAADQNVGRYETFELVFTAATSPANPFSTYLLKLEVTDPDGQKFTIDGFYDGDGQGGQTGKIWKARITPYKPGTWTWRTVSGDAPDSGLANLSGQFQCVESNEMGGVVADGQHFRYQNGRYIYLVGNFLDFAGPFENTEKSTHVFMSESISNADRQTILDRQVNFHAANKMNVYFANKDDYNNHGKLPVTPWLGTAESNDKTKMNLARWRLYDGYILTLKDQQLLAEMWFFADDSNFGSLSEADMNRLLRYGMARTSAFSHMMYVIALEWSEGWSPSEITAAGNYIQAHNPWKRLLSVHNHTDWVFSGESWPTFIATQAGNSAQPAQVNSVAISMRNNESIPHIDEEFGILEGTSSARLRSNLWANFCGGAAGGGTGSDLKAFQRFISQSQAPFYRMAAANHLVKNGGSTRFVLAEMDHHYVVYSAMGAFELEVSGSDLQGRWFDPRNPNASLSGPFNVSPGSQTFTPPNNVDKDWVLWISDGSNLNVTHLPVVVNNKQK